MFKFNPKGQYLIPLISCIGCGGREPASKYHDVTTMTIFFISMGLGAIELIIP